MNEDTEKKPEKTETPDVKKVTIEAPGIHEMLVDGKIRIAPPDDNSIVYFIDGSEALYRQLNPESPDFDINLAIKQIDEQFYLTDAVRWLVEQIRDREDMRRAPSAEYIDSEIQKMLDWYIENMDAENREEYRTPLKVMFFSLKKTVYKDGKSIDGEALAQFYIFGIQFSTLREEFEALKKQRAEEEKRHAEELKKAEREGKRKGQEELKRKRDAEIAKFMRQGKITNVFASMIPTAENTTVNAIGAATFKSADGTLSISLTAAGLLPKMKTSTHQLFDYATAVMTSDGFKSKELFIPLEDFMRMRGLKDKREARRQVSDDLEVLVQSHIIFREERNGTTYNFAGQNFFETCRLISGKTIYLKYTENFFEYLKASPVMPITKQLFSTDNHRYPHAYYLYRKLLEHNRLNAGKANEHIIAVKTLLKAAPLLPTYEEINKGNRHYGRRIITPFENNLDYLAELGYIEWHYCGKNGEELPPDTDITGDITAFRNALIYFDCKQLAGLTQLVESREQHRKAAQKAKSKAAADKKKKSGT